MMFGHEYLNYPEQSHSLVDLSYLNSIFNVVKSLVFCTLARFTVVHNTGLRYSTN